MIEDGLRRDIPGLHLLAKQDLGPVVVIITPLLRKEGTQDLLHLKRKGTAKRSHTPHVPVGRGHTHDPRLSMVPEASVKVRPEAKAGAEAEALLLKTMPGSQMEMGLLVSNQPIGFQTFFHILS